MLSVERMQPDTDQLPIHARKRYRVILEGFDPGKETAESFALKLSMRMRSSLPWARHVLQHLPRQLRDGLTSTQANRLKAVLETLGGRVRIEMHVVVPGGPPRRTAPTGPAAGSPSRAQRPRERNRCPACGWEEEKGAPYCALCHQRFGAEPDAIPEYGMPPDENPLDVMWGAVRTVKAGAMFRRWGWPIAAVVVSAMIVLILAGLAK